MLKIQVDTFRRERVIYDNVFRKIEHDIDIKNKKLEKLI